MKYIDASLVLLACLLTGCQSTSSRFVPQQPVRPAASIPRWVNELPPDSAHFLYGMGEGQHRQMAIDNALADLSAKLGVTVSARFSHVLTVENRGYELITQDTERAISTDINAISINQYQVVESYTPFTGKVYILLKTDKEKLFNAYRQEIEQKINRYRSHRLHNNSLSLLQRYQQVLEEKHGLLGLYRKLMIAESLNPKAPLQAYMRYEQQVLSDYRGLKKKLKFNVLTNDASSKAFANPLKKILAQEHVMAAGQQSRLKVQLTVSERLSQTHGFYIGRYDIVLKVFDGRAQVGGNQFFIKGQGVQNYLAAQKQAIKKFNAIVSADPLWQVLGLEN